MLVRAIMFAHSYVGMAAGLMEVSSADLGDLLPCAYTARPSKSRQRRRSSKKSSVHVNGSTLLSWNADFKPL